MLGSRVGAYVFIVNAISSNHLFMSCVNVRVNGPLGFQRKTGIPGDYENKVVNFHRCVINLCQKHSYLLSQIGNADQTPVYFEMSVDNTVNRKGESSVMIRTSGSEKQIYIRSYCA